MITRAAIEKLVKSYMKDKQRGAALLAEGKSKPKPKPKPKTKASGRKPVERKSTKRVRAHALLAEGRTPGAVAKKKKPERVSVVVRAGRRHAGTTALLEINKIARRIKREHPQIEHKEAISKASEEYRRMKGDGLRRHTAKRSRY
jgi:hypothetical protein